MSSSKRVDVIIPCYNYGHFLDQCLSAVIAQTMGDFSVLVIDNASEDNTPEIMGRWLREDSRVRYLRNDVNLGLVASMKKAYHLTSAEYVVLLPADDLWQPTFLERTAAALDEHPECTYAYTGWRIFLDDGSGSTTYPEMNPWVPHQVSGVVEDMTCLLLQNWIPLSFGLFRRSVCDSLGGMYPEHLPMLGDLLLWMRLSALGKSYFVEEPLGRLRKHGKNESHNLFASGRSAFEHIHVLDLVHQSDLWQRHIRLFAKVCQIRRLIGGNLCDLAFAMGNEDTLGIIRDYVNSCRDEFYVTVARAIISCLRSNLPNGTPEDARRLLDAALAINPGHIEAKSLIREMQTLDSADYPTWIRNHGLNEIDAELFAERMVLRWQVRPVFHLIIQVAEGEQELLSETIDSLSCSFYDNWRLTVVANFVCPDPIFDELPILRWMEANESEVLSALNQAVVESDADWFIHLPAGTRIEPYTFLRFGDYINLHPDWALIYCDDDKLNFLGQRFEPRFKPDMNLDMLRSSDYIGPAFVSRRALALAGATAFLLADAKTYDLTLRILDAHGESAVGHIADVLIHLPDVSDLATDEALQEALELHLQRRGIAGNVSRSYLPGTLHIEYLHPSPALVSIIIPASNQLERIRRSLTGLLEKTAYANFEVIVVNNRCSDPELHDYFGQIVDRYQGKVRVLSNPHTFSYPDICNIAASEARGEYLLFLSGAAEVMHPDWLSQMMSHAQRPEVGVVGARLLDPKTGRVQHAGLVLGLNLIVGRPFSGKCGVNDAAYMNRGLIEQDYSAVNGACQLVRRSLYVELGGQNSERLPFFYGAVDFCLRVREAGFKVVWTPFATLLHHDESSEHGVEFDADELEASRLSGSREQEYMLERWLPLLARDPAYNPNLSLNRLDMAVEHEIPLNWDVNFNDRRRVFGIGATDSFIKKLLESLSQAGKAQCEFMGCETQRKRLVNVTEMARLSPDVFIINPKITGEDLANLRHFRDYLPLMRRIFVINESTTELMLSVERADDGSSSLLAKCLELSDRLIVSNAAMSNVFCDMVADIHIVPERLHRDPWKTLFSLRRQGKKPRVGWVSSRRSADDLMMLEKVVKTLSDEVEWVILGNCPEALRPFVAEEHALPGENEYPAKLAGLNLDLAIDPLTPSQINETRSVLRLLEFGILGCPVVCSDTESIRLLGLPVTCVPCETEEWVSAIRSKLGSFESGAAEGLNLKNWVHEYGLLEDHLDEWVEALLQ